MLASLHFHGIRKTDDLSQTRLGLHPRLGLLRDTKTNDAQYLCFSSANKLSDGKGQHLNTC